MDTVVPGDVYYVQIIAFFEGVRPGSAYYPQIKYLEKERRWAITQVRTRE